MNVCLSLAGLAEAAQSFDRMIWWMALAFVLGLLLVAGVQKSNRLILTAGLLWLVLCLLERPWDFFSAPPISDDLDVGYQFQYWQTLSVGFTVVGIVCMVVMAIAEIKFLRRKARK